MPLDLCVGDKVQLKKKHPCGGNIFTLQRVGADCRASCDTCGAQIWMTRREFEKKVKKIEKQIEGE
ncbi:MAG: DUF951 domain-containing protein [Clostridia bacterium]|nr:DUF951 domain-containing protein [Clostridia bacterium]